MCWSGKNNSQNYITTTMRATTTFKSFFVDVNSFFLLFDFFSSLEYTPKRNYNSRATSCIFKTHKYFNFSHL